MFVLYDFNLTDNGNWFFIKEVFKSINKINTGLKDKEVCASLIETGRLTIYVTVKDTCERVDYYAPILEDVLVDLTFKMGISMKSITEEYGEKTAELVEKLLQSLKDKIVLNKTIEF